MNWLLQRIRKYLRVPSLLEIWVLRGSVKELESRCERLEQAMREINPGLNI